MSWAFLRRKMSKNKKPEKLVEQKVLSMAHALGMSLDVIESKAVFSVRAKRYVRGSAPIGMSDLVGNDKKGRAVFVELKSQKSKNNLRPEQREFLLRKIRSNCFACTVHEADQFLSLYNEWDAFQDRTMAQEFLLALILK